MSKNEVLYAVIGFLAGVLIAVLVSRNAVNTANTGMMRMGMREMMEDHDEDMSMSAMVDTLKNKTGDDFDKEFTTLMIEHHKGAIDMAELAKTNAKHQEIKSLADDIITAQTREIEMMKEWIKNWDY